MLNVIKLNVIMYAECHYAQCCYSECQYMLDVLMLDVFMLKKTFKDYLTTFASVVLGTTTVVTITKINSA